MAPVESLLSLLCGSWQELQYKLAEGKVPPGAVAFVGSAVRP
jgi:hypothetical protein